MGSLPKKKNPHKVINLDFKSCKDDHWHNYTVTWLKNAKFGEKIYKLLTYIQSNVTVTFIFITSTIIEIFK